MTTTAVVWGQFHGAVCSVRHFAGHEPIGQGTGFLVDKWLITNNHVLQAAGATHVRVQFVGPDGHTPTAAKQFTSSAFTASLVDGEPDTSWDFAILNGDLKEFAAQPRLDLSAAPRPIIGSPVNHLGFHFEDANLSIGSGFLASAYSRAGVDYLQLDTSINHGNSGGPLVDPATGRVIGLVTRKATGLTKQFDELVKTFEANAAAVQPLIGGMRLGNFDMVEGFQVTQNQLRGLALEIRRSANVGIGYAYDISKVRAALVKLGYKAH